tara:strand:+ start:480 stop:611 length:132 start_codon:yes stop_codon:yes gene_type:complete
MTEKEEGVFEHHQQAEKYEPNQPISQDRLDTAQGARVQSTTIR